MVLYFSDKGPSLLYHRRLSALFENEVARAQAQLEKLEKSKLETTTIRPWCQILTSKSVDILTIELPGVEKERVNLDVKERVLHLSAERVMPYSIETTTAAREECMQEKAEDGAGADGNVEEGRNESARALKYSSEFSLGTRIDVAAIQAEYSNGLLTIKLPHRGPETHRITLQ